MKKRLLILGMITCLFGLSACGTTVTEEEPFMTQEDAVLNAENIVELLNQVEEEGSVAEFTAAYADAYPALVSAFEGWEKALPDLGDYNGIIGSEVSYADDQVIVIVTVDGSVHDADVEVIMNKETYVSITTNVQYSFGDLMKNAALNTILGMGTVFVVLILIAFIIYLFNFIPKIQALFTKKEKENSTTSQSMDNTVAQIATKEEAQADDLELVAVIAAAIAASEGQSSTDGFVVRSIRRRY